MTSPAPDMSMSGVNVNPPMPPIQATPMVSQNPILENGGATNTNWKSWAKAQNWVEIGFLILGTAAFFYMIKYYKYRMNVERDALQKMQLKTDELTAEMAGLKTALSRKQSRRGSF